MKEDIKKRLGEALRAIPKYFYADMVIRETIRCVLFQYLKESGLQPIPAFRNPRYPEGPVDIVGLKDDKTIEVAFCSNAAIELKDIKSLDRVPADKKFMITFSDNEKKVQLSKLYLNPGIEHIHI